MTKQRASIFDADEKLGETLDPVLGAGNYRTGVSVECDFSGVDESEEVFSFVFRELHRHQRETKAFQENLKKLIKAKD